MTRIRDDLKFFAWLVLIIGIDMLLLFNAGCASKQKIQVAEKPELPILEQAEKLAEIPKYNSPSDNGMVEAVAKDDLAPFDGVLLDEVKAESAISLRIDYDELYGASVANRKYLLTVVSIQEQGLQRLEEDKLRLQVDLREIRDSWWQQNKFNVGVALGIVSGVGLTIATGLVWAKIERENDNEIPE